METDSTNQKPAKEETLAGSPALPCSAILVTCGDCGTRYEMGNGQMTAGEKFGYYRYLGHCPKCDQKTWSEPIPIRPMTRAEIAAAFHSLNDQVEARRQ